MTIAAEIDHPSAKDVARAVLDNLPDDATLDDIVYALYVREKVEQGLRDAEAGDYLTQDEIEVQVRQWRESGG